MQDNQKKLEEVAERLYPINNTGSMFMPSRNDVSNSYRQEAFIEGANWQSKNKDMTSLLQDLLKHEKEIVSSPIRFNGVHVEDIKKVFKEYGVEIKVPF
jgi:hypothetical protein